MTFFHLEYIYIISNCNLLQCCRSLENYAWPWDRLAIGFHKRWSSCSLQYKLAVVLFWTLSIVGIEWSHFLSWVCGLQLVCNVCSILKYVCSDYLLLTTHLYVLKYPNYILTSLQIHTIKTHSQISLATIAV